MKRVTLAISLIIISIFGYSQIDFRGIIIDSVTGNSVDFAGIEYIGTDSLRKRTITNTSGHFELKLPSKGIYYFKSSSLGYGQSLDTLNIENDTSVIIKLTQPFVYTQPCRNIIFENSLSLDLPNSDDDIYEYNRIISQTKKLGLESTLSNVNSMLVRIWFEPAFEYLGGGIYELSYSSNTTKVLKYRYSSNYIELIDSLEKNNIYIDNDSIFDGFLKFNIYKKESLNKDSNYNNIEIKKMIQDLLNAEDYCLSMTGLDRHPALDGISYHIEINYMNKYKFVSFSNPECIKGKYKQVDSFLELLDYIQNRFE